MTPSLRDHIAERCLSASWARFAARQSALCAQAASAPQDLIDWLDAAAPQAQAQAAALLQRMAVQPWRVDAAGAMRCTVSVGAGRWALHLREQPQPHVHDIQRVERTPA